MARVVAAVLLLALAGGCAPNRPPSRIVPTTWSVVTALVPGTFLRVELDGDRTLIGTLDVVSDVGLTIREGRRVRTPSRREIGRIYTREPFDPPRWRRVVRGAIAGCVAGGLAAVFLHSITENQDPADAATVGLTLGCGGGAALTSLTPAPASYRERLVYVR